MSKRKKIAEQEVVSDSEERSEQEVASEPEQEVAYATIEPKKTTVVGHRSGVSFSES